MIKIEYCNSHIKKGRVFQNFVACENTYCNNCKKKWEGFYEANKLFSRSRTGSIQGSTPTSRREIPFPLFSVICYRTP